MEGIQTQAYLCLVCKDQVAGDRHEQTAHKTHAGRCMDDRIEPRLLSTRVA